MRRSTVLRGLAAGALLAGLAAPTAVADPPEREPEPCTTDKHADPPAGGEWSTMSGDLGGTRYQPEETLIGPDNAATLTMAWAKQVSDGGATGSVNSTPTVVNGCVYVAGTYSDDSGADAGARVSALDLAGNVVWQVDYPLHFDPQRNARAAAGLGGPAVSAVVVHDGKAITFVNEAAPNDVDNTDTPNIGPYAVAIDASTGEPLWESAPFDTYKTSYTNGSPLVIPSRHGAVVFAGWSPPEGDSLGQGGFVLLDVDTGELVKKTYSIPEADQVDGDGDGLPDHAGGGIWAPPSYDEESGYAFIGGGNTFSKMTEHPHTNAILKIDLGDRRSDTFGEIVGAAKGTIDQYHDGLEFLRETDACDASDLEGFAWPLDDPVCGQLDLDFGAPVNVFDLDDGRTVVAGLQKAGVVHLFDADTLEPVWSPAVEGIGLSDGAIVGAPCAPCNAAATAVDPVNGIAGVSAPGGTAFMLDADTGALRWAVPIGDGAHYNGVSAANGVVYSTDNFGTLNMFDAATGVLLMRHPIAADLQLPAASFSSSGIAIAGNTLFVAVSAGAPPTQSGWVVAYQLPSA